MPYIFSILQIYVIEYYLFFFVKIYFKHFLSSVLNGKNEEVKMKYIKKVILNIRLNPKIPSSVALTQQHITCKTVTDRFPLRFWPRCWLNGLL